jgi:P-type Mg2+ transporter
MAESLTGARVTEPPGLSAWEAEQRRQRFGPNLLNVERRPSLWAGLSVALLNPLALTLLTAATISALLGQHWNAGLIVSMVVISGVINYLQWHRARIDLERLRSRVALLADVVRDGERIQLPASELVPGDVLHLEAGDLVPADAVLHATRDLHVIESALTGEAFPVEKHPPAGDPTPLNRVFMGTAVASGIAVAIVTATGERTEFAHIVSGLRERPPATEFEIGIARFSRMIAQTVAVLAVVVGAGVLLLGRPPLDGFLFAVALAVGLTPEFLPMISTVTLSRAAVVMSRAQVIVKHLPAIQQLGSVDVLCCDKTGTLTEGVMRLASHVEINGQESDEIFQLAFLNSYCHLGVPTRVDAALKRKAADRNPLDTAILAHDQALLQGWERVDEVPFDFERRCVSVVLRRGDDYLLIVKGAPEVLAASSAHVLLDGSETEFAAPLREVFHSRLSEYSRAGFRTLGVCRKRVPAKPAYSSADERDLTFCGFLLFTDPVVPDVLATVQQLKDDGVELKILTGDQEELTFRVCREIGISAPRVLTGAELDALPPDAYHRAIEDEHVFARLTPQQKYRIIERLRSAGHVVGFMGDGINDAPSLRLADVGISVAGAVDVARDAADVVLTEHKLAVLHQAIIEGRRAFANLMKYIFMSSSSNFGNVLSMAIASFFLPFLPMTASQVLLNNLLYDSSQIAIPADRVQGPALKRPHRWNVGLIRRFMSVAGPVSSIFDVLTFVVLIRLWHADASMFRTAWFLESLATQTLVLFVVRSGQPFWRDVPSPIVVGNCLAMLIIGIIIPFTSLGVRLEFARIPAALGFWLVAIVIGYLASMEALKHWLLREWWE